MEITKLDLDRLTTEDIASVLSIPIQYKYSSLNIALNNILSDGTLKFSNPSEYNDPFDCHEYILRVDLSQAAIEDYINKNYPDLKRQHKRKLIRKFTQENIYQKLRTERTRFKISCFSKEYTNILLWSHYGDNHKGLCIGFHFPYKYDNKFILSPVSYIEEIPKIDRYADTMKMIRYWLSVKSKCWDYEQEIRAIRKTDNTEAVEYITYDKSYVKEIIFGCRVSNEDIKQAKNELKKNGFDLNGILFKRLIIDKFTFTLKEIQA